MGDKKTVGVFGGSFNPPHEGHVRLARALVERGIVDEVWLVLSPLNPLKEHPEELASDADRLEMLRLAVEPYPELKTCDVELTMPRPSYTVDTLRLLQKLNPDCRFRLIVGADNYQIFHRWKEPGYIKTHFAPIVYPRPGYPAEGCVEGLPLTDLSSTQIRKALADGQTEQVNNLLPAGVLSYITRRGLYQQKPRP